MASNEKRSLLYGKGHEGKKKECISGPYMSNQSDDAMGQLCLFFPLPYSCSTSTSVHELPLEIACFESSLWMKLWNIKDATSHSGLQIAHGMHKLEHPHTLFCPATTVRGICTSLGWLHLGCSGMKQILGQWDTQVNIQVIQQIMILLFPLMLERF